MLTTVLFDMGGTLEDIWYNEDTQRATCRRLLEPAAGSFLSNSYLKLISETHI